MRIRAGASGATRAGYTGMIGAVGVVAASGLASCPAGASEALVEVRTRSGPRTPLRELIVRGSGAVLFAAVIREGGGGDRARVGLAFPVAGGLLHAGALRSASAGVEAPRAGSVFRSWRSPLPAVSVAGSQEGVAWVRPGGGVVWVRGPGEPASVAAWASRGGARIAGRAGVSPAGRLDVRGPRAGRFSCFVQGRVVAARAALVGPDAVLSLERIDRWRARLGVRGEAAGGRWRAEGAVAWGLPARSDVSAEWIRRHAGRELRLAARVNRVEDVVRTSGAARFEVSVAPGAFARIGVRRALVGEREGAVGLEWRRRALRLLMEASLPERAGRRFDLRVSLGAGRVRVRGRVRLQARRGPELEVALSRRFALTSPGRQITMPAFGP